MRERRAYTVGHSTHAADTFLALLARHGVVQVADVRRFPRSRRHPHFNTEHLAAILGAYVHLPELGGRRRPRAGTPNGGWEVEAFRGYADHMDTPEFAAGMARLEGAAREHPTAVMCAEASWWRCHRRLVSDALAVRGWAVAHIGPDGGLTEHELTAFAQVRGTHVTYPPPQLRLG